MFDVMTFLDYLEDEVGLDPIGGSDMIADAMNWARFAHEEDESPGSLWDRFKRTKTYAKYGGLQALSEPYGDLRDVEGAAVALEILRLRSEHDELGEQFQITYQETRWDSTSRAYTRSAPHFVAYAECSDTFFWGTSDAEEITDSNLPLLKATLAEIFPLWREAEARDRAKAQERTDDLTRQYAEHVEQCSYRNEDGNHTNACGTYKPTFPQYEAPRYLYSVADLFAARARKMRPQGAAYKVRYPEPLWESFNAAGPEREVGLGNPREPGQ